MTVNKSSLRIRPYSMEDKEDLGLIADSFQWDFPPDRLMWKEFLFDTRWNEENAWVLDLADRPIGYARVDETPGLEGVFDLNGFIAAAGQRKGHGTILLNFITDVLKARGARRLHHATVSQQSAAYMFLTTRGFHVEHIEISMELQQTGPYLSDAELSSEYLVKTYRKQEAISHFLGLYDDCFDGLPWYQPYDLTEVASELLYPADLLFLHKLQEPIGFCWIHHNRPEEGEIEPIGLLPQFQGRGLGALLLKSGLNRLRALGVYRVKIGAWETNLAALNLYRKIGFQNIITKTYLAIDL
jgi:ribosomal protein S18 acetylase RimI-like enzyme